MPYNKVYRNVDINTANKYASQWKSKGYDTKLIHNTDGTYTLYVARKESDIDTYLKNKKNRGSRKSSTGGKKPSSTKPPSSTKKPTVEEVVSAGGGTISRGFQEMIEEHKTGDKTSEPSLSERMEKVASVLEEHGKTETAEKLREVKEVVSKREKEEKTPPLTHIETGHKPLKPMIPENTIITETIKAEETKSSLQKSLKQSFKEYKPHMEDVSSLEKQVKNQYNEAINQIESNIKYIKKYGTNQWYEYNGKRYKGTTLISLLESEKKRLEEEKQKQLEEIQKYKIQTKISFAKGLGATGRNIISISKYIEKLKELGSKGAYAVKGKEGELIIYPSKEAYEKEKYLEKTEKEFKSLKERMARGDVLATLEYSGKRLVSSLGSFEGFAKNIEDWLPITKKKRSEGRIFGELSWKWSHSDIWGKAGMALESPGAIIGTSIVGGYGAGLGVGAISRIAPTAGKVAKVGLAGAGILAGGTAAYDIGRTAIVEKDISKALAKGLVYGISFYGAGKLFKSGCTKGFKKAHVWWMGKHKPTFKITSFKKTPYYTEGFQELSYRYSLGRRIHETIFFKGTRMGEYDVFVTRGKGTLTKGIFRPKTSVFEIPPEVSISKEPLFFSAGRRGISFGISRTGKPHPAVFFEKEAVRSVVSPEYIQRSAWVSGYYVSKGGMRLPFRMEGVIYEPKGFTYRGGEKPSFLTPIRGKPTGKVPLSSLYKTEQLTKSIPLRPPLETGELPIEFRIPLVPILVSKKISIKPFSALKTEPKAYELKGLPKISTKGGALLLLLPKLKTKTVQKQKLKLRQMQRQRTKQLQLKKLKLEMESLSKTKVDSLSLIKTKVSTSLKRKTAPVLKMKQLQGQKLRLRQIVVQKPILRSKLKLRSLSITIPSLKLKGITATKTKMTEISTIPISPPPVGKPKLKFPSGKKVSLTVKKRKGRKTRRRKWKKTLLASPFLVEESYIKYGKATHPKPTKKLWKVGYRTMFKIPTVELMKKGRRKKKGGRER